MIAYVTKKIDFPNNTQVHSLAWNQQQVGKRNRDERTCSLSQKVECAQLFDALNIMINRDGLHAEAITDNSK